MCKYGYRSIVSLFCGVLFAVLFCEIRASGDHYDCLVNCSCALYLPCRRKTPANDLQSACNYSILEGCRDVVTHSIYCAISEFVM